MEKSPCRNCRFEKLCAEGTVKKAVDCPTYQKWAKKYLGGKKK